MVDAYWDFPKLSFYTRLAGDPEPYSEDPEEEPDFDAIGEWTIDVQTKEVRFIVDITG
jgi:hypothetical protein